MWITVCSFSLRKGYNEEKMQEEEEEIEQLLSKVAKYDKQTKIS